MHNALDVRSALTLPGINWASVVAGAVVSLALTIILIWFGAALGLSVISPWAQQSPSPTNFKIATGLYLVVTAMISSALGGHIAGRLRGGWDSAVHANEVYFRDTANGFVSWALATVVGAVLLASAATGIAGMATGGLVQGATQAASSASSGPAATYIDQLLRPSVGTNAGATPNPDNSRAELSRLLLTSLTSGKDMSAEDRGYIAQVIAQQTGLSPPEAQKRVDDTINAAKQALEATRKATMQLAYWIVASLLIGAFSASIAAAEAGGFRDRNWSKP
jgi:hypothetical protein